jgi:hypothetical protein
MEVVRAELLPFGKRRIDLKGPDVLLSSRAAIAFSLVFMSSRPTRPNTVPYRARQDEWPFTGPYSSRGCASPGKKMVARR